MDSGLEIEVEQGTEEWEDTCRQKIDRKEIRTGMQILATQEYKKNLDIPVGEELDFKQYSCHHEENTHGWLVDDGNGQVAYVHHRRDTPGRGKRHNQERGARKED